MDRLKTKYRVTNSASFSSQTWEAGGGRGGTKTTTSVQRLGGRSRETSRRGSRAAGRRGGPRPGDLGEVSPERTTLRGETATPRGGPAGRARFLRSPESARSCIACPDSASQQAPLSVRWPGVPGSEGMSLSPRGYLAPRAAPASWVGEGRELPPRPAVGTVGTVGTGPTRRPRQRQVRGFSWARSQHHDRGRMCRSLQREVVVGGGGAGV